MVTIKRYILYTNMCHNVIYKVDDVIHVDGKISFTNLSNMQNYVVDYDKIRKSSDRIIDLLEYDDLVETEAVIGNVMNLRPQIMVVGGLIVFKEDVKAIYKKQPNGDYTRYEVR